MSERERNSLVLANRIKTRALGPPPRSPIWPGSGVLIQSQEPGVFRNVIGDFPLPRYISEKIFMKIRPICFTWSCQQTDRQTNRQTDKQSERQTPGKTLTSSAKVIKTEITFRTRILPMCTVRAAADADHDSRSCCCCACHRLQTASTSLLSTANYLLISILADVKSIMW